MSRMPRRLLCLLFSSLFTVAALAQDRFEKDNDKNQKDNPAAFAEWFLRSRTPRNTKASAAALLAKGTEQKMQLRAQHLRQLQIKRAAAVGLAGVGDGNSVWTSLGPTPIVWGGDATQSWTGRVTAVAVDQDDSTGNTVLVGGAYGGVWRTTNATDSAANIQWTSLTDDQATLSVGAIAIQPGSHGNTIIVGTGEPNSSLDSYYGLGILVSNNAGSTWTLTQTTADGLQLSGKSISAVAFNTRSGSTNNVVAGVASPGTAEGLDDGVRGAIYSSDAGASWHAASITDGGTTLTGSSVVTVTYNPHQNKFYLVMRRHGVFVSSDQGHTFTRLAGQPNATALSAANCPAATSANCALDRGVMAVRYIAPGSESTGVDEMYVWLIGYADNSGDPVDLNVYQTKDGGTTWTQISETGAYATTGGDYSPRKQSWYNAYLGAVPNGAGTDLYLGSVNIFKCPISSTNLTCTSKPFINLTHVYDSTCYGTANDPNVHPDQHGFDYLGSNPKIAFFGNDGGMYRTLDETKLTNGNCTALNVFDSMNAGLGSFAQFIWGSQGATNNSEVMGGTQDNGTMYVDSANTAPGTAGWTLVWGGDGGYNWIDSSDNWYTANTYTSIYKCPGGAAGCTAWVSLVQDDGTTQLQLAGDGAYTAFYTPYILDPQDNTKLIIGTCRIWRGGNSSSSWPSSSIQNELSIKFNQSTNTVCGSDGSDATVAAIAAGGPKTTSGSTVIYAGTSSTLNPALGIGGQLYMTKSAGAPGTPPTRWGDITETINPLGYTINAVAMDPHDATGGTVVAGIQGFTGGTGKVWRSTSFGSSWIDISGNLPDVPVNDLLVDPDNGSVIYAATDIGVFVTSNEATWTEVGPNTVGAVGFLPNTTVFHIAMYHNGSDKRLRAWTHGRGAWETVLSSAGTGVTSSGSSLTFSSTVGTTSAAQTVTLTNHDAVAVTVQAAVLSGSDIADFAVDGTTTTCGASLGAGSTCKVGFTFTPPSIGTSFSATASIATSGVGTPTVSISLNGTGTAPTAGDFTYDFGSNPSSVTVKAGSSAPFQFNVNPDASGAVFNPGFALSCSGLPTKTSCSFNPASITAGGQVALTIRTTASTSAAPGQMQASNSRLGGVLAGLALPGIAFLIPGLLGRSRRKRMMMYLGMMLILVAMVGMGACGGGGGGGGGGTTHVAGTQPGSYTVHISGSYNGHTNTQDVTLVVQ